VRSRGGDIHSLNNLRVLEYLDRHVSPNLALLPVLRARGFDVEYCGARSKAPRSPPSIIRPRKARPPSSSEISSPRSKQMRVSTLVARSA
jgi:hypothetical protein